MNVLSKFKHVLYFILIGILSLQACKSQTEDNNKAAKDLNASQTSAMPQEWFVNLNEAYAESVKEQKPVMIYFTASDTCRLCDQLEANIFSAPLFKEWAAKKVVLFKIDVSTLHQLPQGSREQNTAMAKSLKIATYPTIWILHVTHEVDNGRFKVKPIGYTGYHLSPEKFIGSLQNFLRK